MVNQKYDDSNFEEDKSVNKTDLKIEEDKTRKKTIKVDKHRSVSGTDLKTISLEDWIKEAEKLFGKDKKKWKFKCPSCGNVQTPGDFIELTKLGIAPKDLSPETSWFSCIGRYDTRIKKVGTIFADGKKSPCNYTNGGLFCFAKVFVIDDDGKKHPVFDFVRE